MEIGGGFMRPIIGITPCHYEIDGIELTSIWRTFIEIIERVGGTVLLIPSHVSEESLLYYIDQLDGLLLPGGQDIYPPNYNQKIHDKSGPFDLDRDEIEMNVIKLALDKHIPILGICRGAQLLNLHFGGTLHQHLTNESHSQWTLPEKFNHIHQVNIIENSKLYEFGKSVWSVNSGHHQGVDVLGNRLKANALAPDGLVEGFEHEDEKFILGIQWHPEVLQTKGNHHRWVFKKFIEACK